MQTKSIFAPAQNQTTVQHLIFTVEKITALPNGSLILGFRSGNIGSSLHVPNTPNRPEFILGADYCVEFPKDSNPLSAPYSAIYPKSQKPTATTIKEVQVDALIAINHQPVGNTEIQTVNARELHQFLEVKSKFADWMKNRVSEYGFIENQDFVSISKILENGGRRVEYALSLDMAKELAMVERNEKGKQARLYFIECEKKAKAVPAIPQTLPEALRLAADLAEEKNKLTQQVKALEVKEQALDRIATASGSLCITNAAKSLNIPPKKLFAWLQANKWIYRRAGGASWTAYQNQIQRGVLEHKITTIAMSDGSEKITEQVLVTAKGLTELSEKLQAAQMAA